VYLREYYHHVDLLFLGETRELCKLYGVGIPISEEIRNLEAHAKYCRARNSVVSQLRNAKANYFHKLNPSKHKQFGRQLNFSIRSLLAIARMTRSDLGKTSSAAASSTTSFSEHNT